MIRRDALGLRAILLFLLAASGWSASAPQNRPLSPAHKAWLEDEVAAIITPAERDVFLKLETDADRESLIAEFWRQRDPTPGTDRNAFREEHYRRLEFADKTFGRGVPFKGRKTERGRLYVALGPPLDVQRYMSSEAVPMELWTISGQPGLGQSSLVRVLFYQRGGVGDYLIYNPSANSPKDLVQTPRRAALDPAKDPQDWDEWDAGAMLVLRDRMLLDVMSLAAGGPKGINRQRESILLAEVQANPQRGVDARYALAILEHKPVVEVSYSVRFMGNRTAAAVLEDADGTAFLHYALVPQTVTLIPFENRFLGDLRTTLRLADEAGRTGYQNEKTLSLDLRPEELKSLQEASFQLFDAVPVIPGRWTFTLLMENLVSKEFTTVEKTIDVPGPGGPAMSPILLARRIVRDVPTAGTVGQPFQVGSVRVYPSVNNVFSERQAFSAFVQLRGIGAEMKEKGTLTWTLTGDRETLWTVRRALREYPSLSAIVEEIPAARLAAASYVLRAGLADGSGREIAAARTDVLLSSEKVPPLWVSAQPLPAKGDPVIDYALGTQYLNVGRTPEAVAHLAEASTTEPGSVAYATAYGRALLAAGEAAKACAVLQPLAEAKDAGFDLFETLGRAGRAAGRLREAAGWLAKALSFRGNVAEVLNLLGECHADLGEKDLARAAWTKSLEIMPGQPRVRELLEKLR